jgi:hypothetical protein
VYKVQGLSLEGVKPPSNRSALSNHPQIDLRLASRVSGGPRASFLACSNLPLFGSQPSSLLLRALSLRRVQAHTLARANSRNTHTQAQGEILKEHDLRRPCQRACREAWQRSQGGCFP